MSSHVLEADRVTRRIGERVIVSGVSVALAAGESVALVGPSGCGKTTLLQMLGLLDRPDAGAVTLGTDDAWSLGGAERARSRLSRIGFVFQHHNLFESMTALDNIALPAWRLTGSRAEATRRAAKLLDRFGLARVGGSRAAQLSGGEAQRVAVARALVNDPRILLADEPTGNLDSASAVAVIDALFDACTRGAALLLVTHDPDLAARATRRIAMLDGCLVRPSRLPTEG